MRREGGRRVAGSEAVVRIRYADELRELAGPFGDVVECHVKRDNGIRGR